MEDIGEHWMSHVAYRMARRLVNKYVLNEGLFEYSTLYEMILTGIPYMTIESNHFWIFCCTLLFPAML